MLRALKDHGYGKPHIEEDGKIVRISGDFDLDAVALSVAIRFHDYLKGYKYVLGEQVEGPRGA
jgi:hypothetical protein